IRRPGSRGNRSRESLLDAWGSRGRRFKSCQPDKVFGLVITALVDLDVGRVPDTCQIRVLCERKMTHRVSVYRDSRQRDCGPDRVREPAPEPLPWLPRRASSKMDAPIGT